MICNKHIEIHMELVNKIQSLKNEYEKKFQESLKEVKPFNNDAKGKYKEGFQDGISLSIPKFIEDLEELLKWRNQA